MGATKTKTKGAGYCDENCCDDGAAVVGVVVGDEKKMMMKMDEGDDVKMNAEKRNDGD